MFMHNEREHCDIWGQVSKYDKKNIIKIIFNDIDIQHLHTAEDNISSELYNNSN